MNRQGFDKISSNCDVMIHIYKMLNFIDQLRLSRVCVTWKSVFDNFIWTDEYCTMTIARRSAKVVVTNESRASPLFFEPQELQEFLRVYSDQVLQLTEICGLPSNIQQFRKLTSLSYQHMIIPKEHLQLVAKCCPSLESLHMYWCKNDKDLKAFVLGRHCSIGALLNMKNLRILKLEYINDKRITVRYQHFREIVTKLVKLEYLELWAAIEPHKKANKKVLNQPVNLQKLSITTEFNPRLWSKNFSSYLTNFESLVCFDVRIDGITTQKMLRIIAATCTNLQQFTLSWITFKNIRYFSLPANVNELSICCCDGLTYGNLRQLLTQHKKITKFSSVRTRYEGIFEDFRISPFIQSFYVDHVEAPTFRLSYDGNAQLKELSLYDDSEANGKDVPLASCATLEILNITNGFIPLATILQLQSLRQLTVCARDTPFINWSYIIGLLKHPTIVELTIGDFYEGFHEGNLGRTADIPLEGFPVKLSLLKVPFTLFKRAVDFVLDLFRQNPHLTITVYGDYHMCRFWTDDVIEKMIKHKHFPRDLRTIEICCNVMNCQELRRDFDKTMEKFQHEEYHEEDRQRKHFYFHLCRASRGKL